MRIVRYLSLLLIFCFSINVYAIENCNIEKIARLNELAKNVEFKYNYEIIEEKDEDGAYKYAIYKINVLNMSNDLRISYIENEYQTINITVDELENMTFNQGANLEFTIYSYTTDMCTDRVLKKVSIKLPYYNDFFEANKDKCEQYREFKYCNEFIDNPIDDAEVAIDEFNQYINSGNTSVISKKINSFFNSNILLILCSCIVIFILVIVIFRFLKKRKEDEI